MTRGFRVRRGVVMLSLMVAGALNPDGTMRVPGDFQVAGWFTGGPQPGQLGPAVVAGHVDSRTGPAVLYRLRDLRPGDQIRVVRADRRVVRFQAGSLASFDRARRSYRDNLVVSVVRVADGHGRVEAGR